MKTGEKVLLVILGIGLVGGLGYLILRSVKSIPPLGEPFTFGQMTGTPIVVSQSANIASNGADLKLPVKNGSNQAVTHSLTPYKQVTVDPTGQPDASPAALKTWKQIVTLNPGTSETVEFKINQGIFRTGLNEETCLFFVEDELGNRSNIVTL